MRTRTKVLLAAAAAAMIHQSVHGATRSWLVGNNGLFETTTNWSSNLVPGVGDTARFNLADAGYTVTFGASHQNADLDLLNDRVTLNLAGFTYTLTDDASLSVAPATSQNGTLTINSGSILAQDCSVAAGANSLG